jgi:uncharacterized protein (TIGR03437 family)
VQVTGSGNFPLFNFPVTFTASGGAQIVGSPTVSTNANGLAYVAVRAPATTGTVNVDAAVGNLSAGRFTFNVSGSGGGGDGGGGPVAALTVVSGDGQLIRNGEPEARYPLVVLVTNAGGAPISGVPVTWTVTEGPVTFLEGTTGDNRQAVSTTGANGQAQIRFTSGFLTVGDPFTASVITATARGISETIHATTFATITSDGNPIPEPSAIVLQPSPLNLTAKAGQTLSDAIEVQVRSAGQLQLAIENVGVSARVQGAQGRPDNDPTRGPAVECIPRPVVLTNENGVATCDLRVFGRTTTGLPPARIILDVGGLREFQIQLTVTPGDPGRLQVTSGNNQSGSAGENLPSALVVTLDDGAGNPLSGQTIEWTVLSGTATVASSTTTTNASGQASNTVRLGNTPGAVQLQARARGGSNPTATFNLQVNVTVSGLNIVSGGGQSAITNTNFASPLVVQVLDTRTPAQGVPGQNVTFAVVSGSATLTPANGVVTTDANGRAAVQVRAGATAGPIVISASVPGDTENFNLTALLPGPVISQSSFVNAASGQSGGVVPGGLYRVEGPGLAQELNGCINAENVIGPWPTRLNNVEVQFGSTLAPILNVCRVNNREFVSFQAPFDMAPGGTVPVTVRVGTGSTLVNNVQVIDLQPGIFETGDQNRSAVALRPNGSWVTPENPARYGELIRVYITGAGPVTPLATTGFTGVANQQLLAPVVVGLNEAGVRVVSATYAEGMIGVYEIIFEVPAGTTTGPARPLGVLLTRPDGQFVFPGNSPTIAIAQ